jgi:hypothetical protein
MEIHFYVLYALAAVSIALGIMALMKIKTAIYLLEQPVVKKMSPQLNLKPIKVDQVDGDANRNQGRNGTPMNRTAGRPEGREDRPPRDDRGPGGRDGRERMPREDRGDRGPRGEGDRGPGGRGGERFGGREGGRDRDRGGRDGHRGDRGDRGDRPPRREFTGGDREPAHADGAPRPAHAEPTASTGAPLAPRRPLPSTVDADGEHKPHSAPEAAPANEAGAADPFFGRDDSDIQHGRRNQLKKKPKFAAEDVEEKAPTEETKVS